MKNNPILHFRIKVNDGENTLAKKSSSENNNTSLKKNWRMNAATLITKTRESIDSTETSYT